MALRKRCGRWLDRRPRATRSKRKHAPCQRAAWTNQGTVRVPLSPVDVGCTLFPIEELASAGGVSRRVMNRMLRDAGIAIVRGGRTNFVSLAELEEKLPAVWDSILAVDALRRAYGGDDA